MRRFFIEYVDKRDWMTRAAANGWAEGLSLHDFARAEDSAIRVKANGINRFGEAVSHAKTLIPQCAFEMPRVYEAEWKGHPRTGSWEDVAFWDCGADDAPAYELPDFTHD